MTYLEWFKNEERRWSQLRQTFGAAESRFINLAGSAMSGGERIIASLTARADDSPMHWGHLRLREQISRYLTIPSPDSILPVAGASQANFLVMQAIRHQFGQSEPPVAIVEMPNYGPLFEVPRYLGYDIFPVDREQLTSIKPPSSTAVVVLSNLNNPTGALRPAREIESLLSALPSRAVVLVDETFLGFTGNEESVARLGNERLIAMGSLSKTLGLSDLRCGWIIAHGQMLEAMREVWLHGSNIGSRITESMSADVLENIPEHQSRVAGQVQANRRHVDGPFDALRDEGLILWTKPVHGCIALLRMHGKSEDTQQFYEFALERFNLAVVPGRWFGVPDHIRIGFGGAEDDVRDGIVRLAEAIRQFRS